MKRDDLGGAPRENRLGTHVDRRVVLCVLTDRKVDPLVLRWQVLRSSRVALDDLELVGRANAALEEDARGTERAGGQDHATIGGERNEAVRANSSVVGLDTKDLRAVAHNVRDEDIVLVREVRASQSSLKVGGDGTSTLAVNELKHRQHSRNSHDVIGDVRRRHYNRRHGLWSRGYH